MYLEIYADILFLINFGMDLIILSILKRILKQKSTWLRLSIASAVGALSACFVAVFYSIPVLLKFILIYIVISILMVMIAFSYKELRDIIKAVFMLFALTFFIGGILNSFYYYTNVGYYFNELIQGKIYSSRSVKFLLITGVITYIIIKLFLSYFSTVGMDLKSFYETQLIMDGKKLCLRGFLDTGNSLRDPLTNKPVILGEYNELKEILPIELNQFLLTYYQNEIKQKPKKNNKKNNNVYNYANEILDKENAEIEFEHNDYESMKYGVNENKHTTIISMNEFENNSDLDCSCEKHMEDTILREDNLYINLKDELAVKIRFIPYHSIGKENGNLIGIIFDEVNIITPNNTIHNNKVIVAIFQGKLTAKEEYQIILHKELL